MRQSNKLTIYRTGAWQYGVGTMAKRGCIRGVALAQLRRHVQAVKPGRDKAQRVVCKAVNRSQVIIRVRGRVMYRWPKPCGIRPNPRLLALYNLARRVTRT